MWKHRLEMNFTLENLTNSDNSVLKNHLGFHCHDSFLLQKAKGSKSSSCPKTVEPIAEDVS